MTISSQKTKTNRPFIFSCIALFICFALSAQTTPRIGIGAEAYETGAQHGTFYSAYLSASTGKSSLSAGPCLQKRSMAVRGVKLSYTYLLGEKERFVTPDSTVINQASSIKYKLRAYSFLQYVNKLPLSYSAARLETITNAERDIDWNSVKLSTLSSGVGIELDIQFKHFTVRNYFGGSLYYHLDYIPVMYHARMSPALTVGTAISIPHF